MKRITASEFNKKFDDDEEVLQYCDLSTIRHPSLERKRVNISFSVRMIQSLDREAQRLGVSRHSLIKLWISERLEAHKRQRPGDSISGITS